MTRLRVDEQPVRSVQRYVRKHAREALEALGELWPVPDEAVHRVRKQLKKARAGLRLVRDAVGAGAYRRDNAALRDAARPLSAVRDARILLDVFDDLAQSAGPPVRREWEPLRVALIADHQRARERALRDQEHVRPLAAAVRTTRRRAKDWDVKGLGWAPVAEGLRRVYKAGRAAWRRSKARPTTAALHEWRKQAKYLRSQLELLEPLWPEVLSRLARRANDLADTLGEDHDLFLLHGRASRGRIQLAAPARARLLKEIEERRHALQERALRAGEALYGERPWLFVDRLDACERVWRKAA
ncbi:MAG TPA: CHAD domain-containing protein [Planctomycetota bacterium]|nr:CHAD domain-containing protein [Planctomycetota bacterium]